MKEPLYAALCFRVPSAGSILEVKVLPRADHSEGSEAHLAVKSGLARSRGGLHVNAGIAADERLQPVPMEKHWKQR